MKIRRNYLKNRFALPLGSACRISSGSSSSGNDKEAWTRIAKPLKTASQRTPILPAKLKTKREHKLTKTQALSQCLIQECLQHLYDVIKKTIESVFKTKGKGGLMDYFVY